MSTAEPRSVLVVDDEAGMRTALRASFLRHGWNVKAAGGVREAADAVDHGNFDLVVTDMRMRDGNGFDVMHHVRAHSPATAVVLLTAFGNVPEAVNSMRGGAVDYLTKPVAFDELHTTAMRALDRLTPEPLPSPPVPPSSPVATMPAPGASIAEVERLHLENTLAAANGNRTRAAAMLGISLRTMRNRIRAYGLPPRTYNRRRHA